MALIRHVLTVLVGVLLLAPGLALAQTPPGLEPPRPLTATTVETPADAPPHTEPVVVRVKLLVGVDGLVKRVELLSAAQPVFDDAVIRAAQLFRFSPGLYLGKPVQVEITFTHTFLPPPPPPAPPPQGGPPLVAVLRGKLVEKGTRAPVSGATIAAEIAGETYSADADRRGRFRLSLPAGPARVTVHAPGYRAFLQQEKLEARQELGVAYYVERERYDPYEILVFGEKKRQELSRVTLRGPEIRQVPGTFGDPFRVVQTLPGVASIMSLLPFPVVRGASPGSTGFLIDGTRVPLLYHLLAGPSVIHPEFIDEVQFYPGGAPVLYGGYTAGIVDGRTRRARSDEKLVDLDANLLQAGGLVRHPTPFGTTVTAAARLGYPGTLISLATDEASLSYWDYQLRLDGGNARNGWTVFAFGASDTVETVAADADPADPEPPLETALELGFHRLDLRAQHGSGAFDGQYRLVGGVDQTVTGAAELSTLVFEPSARWKLRVDDRLEVAGGVEGSLHDTDQGSGSELAGPGGPNAQESIDEVLGPITRLAVGSALAEAFWRPSPRWLVRPGVRGDVRSDGTTTKASADPRLAVRYRLTDLPADATATADGPPPGDDQATWLKAGVGLFHAPPRFLLPLPGLDTLPLRYGLLTAVQSSVGVEVPLGTLAGVDGLQVNLEAFYNDMDPVVFDLSTNPQDVIKEAQASAVNLEPTSSDSGAQQVIDRLVAPQQGRAYGLEVLLRRQSRHGLYGWLAYTLSLSERERQAPQSEAAQWVPYDYDRTHLLNLVAGLPLPRNWDVGARLQWQSGRPATTTRGYNTARTEGYFRLDVRIDKRAVWNEWLFDFYVDVVNVALFPEEITPGATIRYVLPTVGIRGRL